MDRLSGEGGSRISAFLNTVLFLGKNQGATFDSLASFKNEKLLSSYELFIMAYKGALSTGFLVSLISFHHAQVRGDGRISGSVENSSL